MTKQTIAIGAAPNDGTGDPIRTAFTKVNENFTELYSSGISTTELVNGVHTLSLDSDGDLILPDDGGIVFDRANTTIRVGMGFHIASGEGISLEAIDETDPDNLVYKSWYFGSTGGITFPTLSTNLHNGGVQPAQTLQFSDTSQQVIITGPTPATDENAQRLIIQGQRGLGTGEGGDVYLWAGDAEGINGGDIKIYAGDADDATDGYGGYVNIDAGNGFTQGGYVNITAGSGTTLGGNLNIYAGSGGGGTGGNLNLTAGYGATSGGVVQVNTYGHQWQFGTDGALTFPDTTTQTTAYTGLIANGTKASNATGTTGQISYDADYVYICTATNTWSRAALTGGY